MDSYVGELKSIVTSDIWIRLFQGAVHEINMLNIRENHWEIQIIKLMDRHLGWLKGLWYVELSTTKQNDNEYPNH